MKLSTSIVCIALLANVIAFAPATVLAFESRPHGNLAEAQELVLRAYERLSDAEIANDYQLGGHASRAKELLRQVNDEIKQAAATENQR